MIPPNGLSEWLCRTDGSTDLPTAIAWESLTPESWLAGLSKHCSALLAERDKGILCISGKAGSGKSTLGRLLRKQGMPGIAPGELLVIDDSMLHLKWFGIFPRRIKHRTQERDYLAPFASFFSGRRLLVYVNTHPEKRIERCDILLRLRCPEEQREARLLARDPDGAARFASTREASDNPRILAERYLDLPSDQIDFRQGMGRAT